MPFARVVRPALGRASMGFDQIDKAKKTDADRESTEALENVQAILNALPAMVGYWDRDLRNVWRTTRTSSSSASRRRRCSGCTSASCSALSSTSRTGRTSSGALAGRGAAVRPRDPDAVRRGAVHAGVLCPGRRRRRGARVLRAGHATSRSAGASRRRSSAAGPGSPRPSRSRGSAAGSGTSPPTAIVWSDGLYEIYGISPDDFDARYQPGSERVHPEDRERVDAEVRRALETCAPIDLEYRIVRPDGRVRRPARPRGGDRRSPTDARCA